MRQFWAFRALKCKLRYCRSMASYTKRRDDVMKLFRRKQIIFQNILEQEKYNKRNTRATYFIFLQKCIWGPDQLQEPLKFTWVKSVDVSSRALSLWLTCQKHRICRFPNSGINLKMPCLRPNYCLTSVLFSLAVLIVSISASDPLISPSCSLRKRTKVRRI